VSVYRSTSLVDGFPGKSATHGAFGWSSVHVLHGAGRVILAETGPPAFVPLLTQGLQRLGLEPGDVTDVLLTHSHWDHLANVPMFPEAMLWIGARELTWARELPLGTPHQSPLHVAHLAHPETKVSLVDEGEIAGLGITVFATPGHTPGHVSYGVETDVGPVVFAGDAVKNVHELATAEVDMTMDAAASRASIDKLRAHLRATGGVLVPGHDVPLRLEGDTAVRLRPQHAQVSFFAAPGGAADRSISDSAS
jgi:N-acyl homoserine lactone hydrolase